MPAHHGSSTTTASATPQAQQLARIIRERIQREQLADGTFFMTEAELAEEYGTSRTVTREAVSRLQALGILEGRKRKGLFVRHPDPVRLLSNSLPSLLQSEQDLVELAQLRYALEVGAIELAVRNATPEQIAALADLARQITVAVKKHVSHERQNELDVAFHTLLLEMTNCRMISGMQRVLSDFFQTKGLAAREALQQKAYTERMAWEHTALVEAIRDRDVERARAMIRLHIGTYLRPRPAVEDETPAR